MKSAKATSAKLMMRAEIWKNPRPVAVLRAIKTAMRRYKGQIFRVYAL